MDEVFKVRDLIANVERCYEYIIILYDYLLEIIKHLHLLILCKSLAQILI